MKIAIIGGIGSGKSLVIDYINKTGRRTCDCDVIYREVLSQEDYIKRVGEIFPVVKDGEIDKKALAQIVFNDSEKLKQLTQIAHPLIFQKVHKIYGQDNSNLYIEVSAFDKSMAKYFDKIIYIKSLQANRVERVKKRNNFDEEYVLSIMSSQLPESDMQDVADFVIVNDGSLRELYSQVDDTLAKLEA